MLWYSSNILVCKRQSHSMLEIARALTALHPWMLCCWSSRSLLQMGVTKETSEHCSMPTAGTTPFCSFFHWSWQSGSPITWLTNCVCGPPPSTVGVLLNWTTFLQTVWCLIGVATTYTLFTRSNLNLICIEELCAPGVIRSTWQSIAFVERILRCFACVCIHVLYITGPWQA